MGTGLGMPARGGRAWRLATVFALLLGLLVGALGSPGLVAAARSEGCDYVDGAIADYSTGLSVSNKPFSAGEVISITAGGADEGSPTTVRIRVDGAQVAAVAYPGTASYTIPYSRTYTDIELEVTPGIAAVDFACLPYNPTAVAAAGTAAEGGSMTLTAAVTRQEDGAPVPANGQVTFSLNGQLVGTSPTNAQGASSITAPLPAGTAAGTYPFAVQASYAGAPGYAASQGQGPLTVSPAPSPPAPPVTPATMVSVTGTAIAGGTSVALRAAVARQSDGAPVPAGGAVTFTYNGQTFSATTDANGVATATAPLPANTQPGSYPGAVRASYAGAAGYATSQGEGPLMVATASCAARFADVADTDPACPAIVALVNRGVIYGYATNPPTFGPLIQVQRAETAAFLVRALGWGGRAQGPRSFSDLAPLEGTDLATAVRIVANACDNQAQCVAAGPGGGLFEPTKPVTRAEVIAFLTRAFKLDAKYSWADQPGAPNPYTGVPAVHETAIRTYTAYAGGIPDAPTTADGWNAPASRAWVARVLYQALATKP